MEVTEEEVGIAIKWVDAAMLHACLGVAGAPVPQGDDEAASGRAIRAWFSGVVMTVNLNSPVILAGGVPSSEFFHHLSNTNGHHIVKNALLTHQISLEWRAALHAAGLSAGTLFVERKIKDEAGTTQCSNFLHHSCGHDGFDTVNYGEWKCVGNDDRLCGLCDFREACISFI